MKLENPFITSGYAGPEYFCDREKETEYLCNWLVNGNNVALIAPRRIGKTGLLLHSINRMNSKGKYHLFLIDIYATKSLRELVFELGKSILNALKPTGRKAFEIFINMLKSVRTGISFDTNGIPSWNVELGDIQTPEITLDEIFNYLNNADRPCIVAIDEFQVISKYPETNIEALLRTYIQKCTNCRFIFSGSQRHMMAEMFLSAARPFYQSTSIMDLKRIPLENYIFFVDKKFRESGKSIEHSVIEKTYNMFDGITWNIQYIMNELYASTPKGGICKDIDLNPAIDKILTLFDFSYESLLFQVPSRQKELLIAICKEGKVNGLTSSPFLKKYKLTASMVQGAIKGLLEKDFITENLGVYEVYERFFSLWLLRHTI